VNDCCLTPNEQFLAISWREYVTFNEIREDKLYLKSVHIYNNTSLIGGRLTFKTRPKRCQNGLKILSKWFTSWVGFE